MILTLSALSVALFAGLTATQQVVSRSDLDFSQAVEDPATGDLCVLQQVCLPASTLQDLATRLPQEPCPDPNAGDELPAFPPGCNCNVDGDCTGGDTVRCVACVCKDCPASTASGTSGVLNPPLNFVVDTTKSVKPDKYSIFNLTLKVVERIQEIEANIPSYHLVTFNDHGPDFNRNVDFRLDTDDVVEFKQEVISLVFESYDGGRDSRERLMQGLLGAIENGPDKSLVVVFTDNGSKDLRLEREVIRRKNEKGMTVYIVLTPIFEGFPNDPSLGVYERVADQVFYINEVGADFFLGSVESFEETNCL